jgi:hypothetical protein
VVFIPWLVAAPNWVSSVVTIVSDMTPLRLLCAYRG